MRQLSIFAFLTLFLAGPAISEEAGSIAYLPAKDGNPAQTIKLPAENRKLLYKAKKAIAPNSVRRTRFGNMRQPPVSW